MKKLVLALLVASMASFSSIAAPPAYFAAINNGVPFNALLTQTMAELQYIANIDFGPCPGCYLFEVGVIYPDGFEDTWYFSTQLMPNGQIVVVLLPGHPGPHGPDGWEEDEE